MRKVLMLMLSLLIIFVLAACGDSEEKEIDNVDAAGEVDETEDADAEETEEIDESAYDEVLLDDDVAKVVLTSIETVSDEIFGDEYSIQLEIENKSDETIEVQSREVSLDGLMVDDMVIFSQTVSGGKKANAELSIMAFDEELPEFNENIEFRLVILDEGFMEITSADVSVDIK